MAADRLLFLKLRVLVWATVLAAAFLSAALGWGCGPSAGSVVAELAGSKVFDARVLARWYSRRPSVRLVQEEPLAVAARRSAAELAARGVLSHRSLGTSSPLERYRRCGGTGRRVGEVVGVGPSLDEIWRAWEASASHASVLDAEGWQRFGVGALDLSQDQVLVVLLLGNSVLDNVQTERGWAHVMVRARLAVERGDVPGMWGDLVPSISPPLLLGWQGRHLQPGDAGAKVSWEPASPRVLVEVPFDGSPAWLLVGLVEPGGVDGDTPHYTDRVLIWAPDE